MCGRAGVCLCPHALGRCRCLCTRSGVNDVELSLELASTALHIATGYYYDKYGEPYAAQVGFKHAGYLRPGGALVMKVYEVSPSLLFPSLPPSLLLRAWHGMMPTHAS